MPSLRIHRIIGLITLAIVLVLGSASAQETWRSVFYPEDWTPEMRDDQGRFLHDFSYAGYRAGEVPLPTDIGRRQVDVTDPPYNADPTGQQSATHAIQQAIDDMGKSGGGIVFLPEGTYRITFPPDSDVALALTHSGVVVQGAGPNKTFFFLDETISRRKSMIKVAPASGMDWYRGVPGSEQHLRGDVLEPATIIPLDGPPLHSMSTSYSADSSERGKDRCGRPSLIN